MSSGNLHVSIAILNITLGLASSAHTAYARDVDPCEAAALNAGYVMNITSYLSTGEISMEEAVLGKSWAKYSYLQPPQRTDQIGEYLIEMRIPKTWRKKKDQDLSITSKVMTERTGRKGCRAKVVTFVGRTNIEPES